MCRNPVAFALAVLLFAYGLVGAQQGKIPRIAFQTDAPLSVVTSRIEAFRQGMRELGYLEGTNITIDWRSAEGNIQRRPEIASELARLKPDVIVSAGPSVTRALKDATSSIPIVMGQDTDPVASGFVKSLAQPGGNITGLAALAPEVSGKQLELLRDIVPKLSRIVVLGNSTNPGDAQALRETVIAAGVFDVYLRYLDILEPKHLEDAFQTATRSRADALVVFGNPILNSSRRQVVALALKHRLVATYSRPEFIDAGGLMYYGTNYNDLFRRAATYVDKILKGAKPGELPVEQPTKFELVINLKAAKELGLTIPPHVLARADKIVK